MRYDLPMSDIESLCRYQRNVSGKAYIKVTGILMLSKGMSVETVSDSLGIVTTTVYRYWNGYKTFYKSELQTLMTLNFRLVNSHPIFL